MNTENKNQEIKDLVGTFCTQKINEEYFELGEKLIDDLLQEDPDIFKRGKKEIWAASIIYTIGSINFLGDKSNQPYLPTSEIHAFFNTKSGTVATKSRNIKQMLEITIFDPRYSTVAMNEMNPFNNMVLIDGLIMPIDVLDEESQRLLKEARERGGDLEFFTQ